MHENAYAHNLLGHVLNYKTDMMIVSNDKSGNMVVKEHLL